MNNVLAEADWAVNLKANGVIIICKLDAGIQTVALPEIALFALKEKPQVQENKQVKIKVYSNELILTEEIPELDVWVSNTLEKVQFVIELPVIS